MHINAHLHAIWFSSIIKFIIFQSNSEYALIAVQNIQADWKNSQQDIEISTREKFFFL